MPLKAKKFTLTHVQAGALRTRFPVRGIIGAGSAIDAGVDTAAGSGYVSDPVTGLIHSDNFSTGNLLKQYKGQNFWRSGTNVSVVSQQMRIYYPAGTSQSEQRFSFGTDCFTELWFRKRIRIPSNYAQGSGNNKGILMLWSNPSNSSADNDGYSRFDNNVLVSLEHNPNPTPDGGSSGALRVWGAGYNYNASNPTLFPNVISVADRGNWVEYVGHLKHGTFLPAPNGNLGADYHEVGDAILQIWKDGEIVYNRTNLNIFMPDFPGWNIGYELGYANAPYASNTEFLYSEVEYATSNIFGVSL